MLGLLVRVGIDQTYGGWNAPCRDDRSFCYVPIPIQQEELFDQGFETTYHEFEQDCQNFAQENVFPRRLQNAQSHLDPDFRFLSYGDTDRKARRIYAFFENSSDNFIAFYASFKQIGHEPRPLVYAIIGLYRFREVRFARDVPLNQREKNAHTRLAGYQNPNNADIVIFADPRTSGRLRSLIQIGEQHDNHHYYVRNQLLRQWGGISSRNGWIQRSASLPHFCNPDLFLQWFEDQNPQLVHENNIL